MPWQAPYDRSYEDLRSWVLTYIHNCTWVDFDRGIDQASLFSVRFHVACRSSRNTQLNCKCAPGVSLDDIIGAGREALSTMGIGERSLAVIQELSGFPPGTDTLRRTSARDSVS